MKKLLFLIIVMHVTLVHGNELAQSPSPYLAMHGNDPVDWHDINPAALEKARREQKLIFISSGYFACHWCHVMQRESYQDPKIAAFLNRHFVPIKIDRELNPVLDAQLINFVEYTRGRTGWPLNVFLTPEGYPFFGLIYMPPAEFSTLLGKIANLWDEDSESLGILARSAFEELQQDAASSNQRVDKADVGDLRNSFIRTVHQLGNEMEGGFGNSSKFPHAPQLMSLLALGEEEEFLRLTLNAMATEHLYDHINGGFFRYTSDPDWQTPHFEKMLYDNALLASLYLMAGKKLGEEGYTQMGIATLHFMVDSMRHDKGGYVASLSAVDNHGIEGGYYLWDKKQLEKVLDNKSLKQVHDLWGMESASRFEAGYLPSFIAPTADQFKQLTKIYDQLRLARQKKSGIQLPVDDKRLSGWNGLVLSAFAHCVDAGDSLCKAQGMQQARFILGLYRKGVLVHGLDREGNSLGDATLEDYAYVIQGLTEWGRQTADGSMLQSARQLVQEAWNRFHRPDGWMASQTALLPGIKPAHNMPDTLLPSPTSSLLYSGFLLSGTAEKAPNSGMKKVKGIVTQSVVNDPFSYSGLIVFLSGHKRVE